MKSTLVKKGYLSTFIFQRAFRHHLIMKSAAILSRHIYGYYIRIINQ